MPARDAITPAVLRELLDYSPETGALVWQKRPGTSRAAKVFNAKFAGREAINYVDPHGYRRGAIFATSVSAHQVAWAWMTGAWPDQHIDHLNGDRTDNRFANLRLVTRSENSRNMGPRKKRSGLPRGVFPSKSTARPFRAQIVIGGKARPLGYHATIAEAQAAYKAAALAAGCTDRHITAVPTF